MINENHCLKSIYLGWDRKLKCHVLGLQTESVEKGKPRSKLAASATSESITNVSPATFSFNVYSRFFFFFFYSTAPLTVVLSSSVRYLWQLIEDYINNLLLIKL